ncbi:DUF4012 domain-containing protein [Dactylosporangium sp. NPDC051485]|uniref:DUF4012 domain-containing protein n=1 Tax=Dactylosporangium sp. NPDC051485 TaxID=3154846 RepID=UPI003449253F
MPTERLRKLLRTRRRKIVAAAVVLAVVLAGAGLRLAIVGADAAAHLQRAADLVGDLERQLRGGDLAAARVTAAELRRQTGAARDDTHGPSWRLGTALPGAGDDLRAVGAVADAVDALAAKVLPPLLDAADGMSAAMGRDSGAGAGASGADLDTVAAAAPRIEEAAGVARAAQRRLAALDTGGLTGPVRSAVRRVDDGLDRVVPLLDPAARAARLLPALLGAGGPRTYLVLFQNLAEVRATGGMPGAFAVLQADRGKISLVEQGTAAKTLRDFDTPALPLDPDQEDLFTNRLGTYPADVNLTPDFPTAAALIREMYRQRSGRSVDGVLATDPVALAYLLGATGPVSLPSGGQLTAATAVRQLMSEVYLEIAAEADQDAYFAGAAKAVLDRLMGGVPVSKSLVSAMSRATGERRLLAWSAHPQEQAEIAGTPFAGTLPADDGAHPSVGVFLNDGTGAKLDYYLTRSVSLETGRCLDGGARPLRVTITLGSTAPAKGLPRSVLGLGLAGDYTVRTNVLVYAPTGGSPVAARQDGAEVDFGTGLDKGREVAVFTVDLAPGAHSTLVVDLVTGPLPAQEAAEPRLILTPGITPWTTRLQPGRACEK